MSNNHLKRPEEEDPGIITGTWQEGLFRRYGIAVVGFIAAGFIYMDYRALNRDLIALIKSNMEVNSVLTQKITQSQENVNRMHDTITDMHRSLRVIETAVGKIP